MTGNLLLDSVISLATIAFMVLLAWLVFRAPAAPVTKELAQERMSFDEPDFVPAEWLLDDEGRAVIARSDESEFVLAARLGVDIVTRRFAPGGAQISMRDGAIIIRPNDPGALKVSLRAQAADLWARKMNGE